MAPVMLGCVCSVSLLPSQVQAEKENCFSQEETKYDLTGAADEAISLRSSQSSWPYGVLENNAQIMGQTMNCANETEDEMMWKEG